MVSPHEIFLLICADSIQGCDEMSFWALNRLTSKIFLSQFRLASVKISFSKTSFVPETSIFLILKNFDWVVKSYKNMEVRLKTLINAIVIIHVRQKSILIIELETVPLFSCGSVLYLLGLIFLFTFNPHFCSKLNIKFF